MNSQEICITVTFLTGRYHGEEWPPSSARLFQAIVAGVMTCGYGVHRALVEPALLWLEKQSPPRILTCPFERGTAYRIAVPNNDLDVVAREWVKGKDADPAVLKTMKPLRPKRLDATGPHVQYVWHVDSTEANSIVDSLRVAVHCLHTFGWGIDMAYADVTDKARPSATLYEPGTTGRTRLATPIEGTLADLHSSYERFTKRTSKRGVDTHTRPTRFGDQPYVVTGELPVPVTRFVLLKPDDDDNFTPPAWHNCMKVAGWLRHAAAQHLGREFEAAFIQEYVQGHTQADEKSRRVSYVPLPSICGPFPDGQIRRAIVVEPAGAIGEVVRLLELKLTGSLLHDKFGAARCCLGPQEGKDSVFVRYLPDQGATTWRSVTPVVLHGHNVARRGVISVSKTERLLLRAFAMAGFPEESIESLAFQAGPLWPGSQHAAAILVPDHLNGYPRLHVAVRFRQPVHGPVLAGIGRHYGIGLFAATG